MTIENRNLTVGTKLIGRYHKEIHCCEVIQGENGKVKYHLMDGREFKSPSAAGMAVTGHPCDGWIFWKVEGVASATATENQTEVTNPPAEVTVSATENPATPESNNVTALEQANAPTMAAAPAATVEPTSAKKPFHRTPNQKGVSEGQTRWFCQSCGESFLAPYGDVPMACPQGHKA